MKENVRVGPRVRFVFSRAFWPIFHRDRITYTRNVFARARQVGHVAKRRGPRTTCLLRTPGERGPRISEIRFKDFRIECMSYKINFLPEG